MPPASRMRSVVRSRSRYKEGGSFPVYVQYVVHDRLRVERAEYTKQRRLGYCSSGGTVIVAF